MAQSGYTPISIYYSSTATNVPTAGNLVNGELAINITDGKLFYKDNAGVVQTIAGKGGAGVAGGSNTQVQYNSSGSLAGSANMVFDGSTLTTLNSAYTGTLTGGTGVIAIGTNQIYKTSAGIVGIGTATPATFSAYANLAVLNGIVSSSSTTDGGVYIGSTTAGTEIAYLSMGRSYNLAASGDTVLSTSASKPLIFGTNNAERMRIDSSGNVGIGTSSPTTKLTVSNSAGGTGLSLTGSGTGTQYLDITNTGGDLLLGLDNSAGGLTGTAYAGFIGTFTNAPFYLYANSAIKMAIDSAGNVGIGTTSPSTYGKLSVLSSTAANSYGTAYIYQNAATNYPSLQVQQVGAGGNTGDIQGLRVVVDGTGAGYSVAVNRYGTNYTMLLRNDGIFMAGNSRFSPVGTSNSIPASTYYNEEKLYQISQGTGTANYDICTVTSAYTYGTLVIEVSGTIQYAGADQRTASNRKSIIQFRNGSITVADLYTNYVGSFGTINFTYVSDGVIKINVTGATTGVGQGNGIAWVKCVGGQNSSGSVVTPLGFTLS